MVDRRCNLVVSQIGMSWYVPGDCRGEFYFRLYRLGIYTNKDIGMIKQINQEKSDHGEFQKQSGMLTNKNKELKGTRS